MCADGRWLSLYALTRLRTALCNAPVLVLLYAVARLRTCANGQRSRVTVTAMCDVTPGRAPDPADAQLLYERYRASPSRSRRVDAYYAVKPLIPRPVQLAARRTAA